MLARPEAQLSGRARGVVVLVATDARSEETVGISATAFINAFTELDVPRSSGAVSGRFRAGYVSRVLVGSVLVTCRCLAVVRVLGPAGSGAPSGLFSVDSVAQSATSAVGVSLWVIPEVYGALWTSGSAAFLFMVKIGSWPRKHPRTQDAEFSEGEGTDKSEVRGGCRPVVHGLVQG